MKYAGSITIFDDEGNTVYERDLSADEMIGYLIEAAANPSVTEIAGVVEIEPKHEPKPFVRDREGKPCCGSKQIRHKKSCAQAGEGSDEGYRPCCRSMEGKYHKKGCTEAAAKKGKEGRRTVDNRHPFGEPTYSIVKDMLEDRSVDMVSSEKGLDLDEVRRCNLSDDYEDYLAIA